MLWGRNEFRRGERGQAAVETAIVMPLYVFLVLGILQMALANQARLMTKYAAYMATREGAIMNARIAIMEATALKMLTPVASRIRSDGAGAEIIAPVVDTPSFKAKYDWVSQNKQPEADLKIADVRICIPNQELLGNGTGELDFDDPRQVQADQGWRASHKTKLVTQVTFFYRMPIPFANQVIFQIWQAQEVARVLRLGLGTRPRSEGLNRTEDGSSGRDGWLDQIRQMADKDVYVLPIPANYAMRMHSNIRPKDLPAKNLCQIRFPKKGGSAPAPPPGGGGTPPDDEEPYPEVPPSAEPPIP